MQISSRDMWSGMYALRDQYQIGKREKRGWLFGQWRDDGIGGAAGSGAYGAPAPAVLFQYFFEFSKKIFELLSENFKCKI